MFTGIIQSTGTITALDKRGDWTVEVATSMPLDDVALGASIACSGVCLTVIRKLNDRFTVQVSGETLAKTTASKWVLGTKLNLERALRVGDELGGHIVLGHVDGVANIVSRQEDKDSVRYAVEFPGDFAKFIAAKGSVALDGISLTVNAVCGNEAEFNIIPHTQNATTIGDNMAGDEVNFEIDMMARYLDRLKNYGAGK